MRECLLDKRLQWLGYLKRIEENARCSKYKSSRLVVVFLEHNLGKRGMRQSKMIWKKGNKDLVKYRKTNVKTNMTNMTTVYTIVEIYQ